jgi:uncharacterized protein with von Willebrand factor type A (vWA) domain
MSNPFMKFEKFGAVCDVETRKRIAQAIFDKLLKGTDEEEADKSFMSNDETENFASSIEIILANETLREMTKNDPVLAETTTQEILNFIHKTKRAVTALGNPYEDEVKLADSFSVIEQKDHKSYWKIIKEFMDDNYSKEVIDSNFYTRAFNKTFKPRNKENVAGEENQSYESIRDHLAEKWREEILLKIVLFQQEKIDEFRTEFTKQLFEYMQELKDARDMMQAFATDFNQLFDMPKGGMSKENFDVLKKYHELLEMNHAVKDLVQMLGRMRQAVDEEEKEAFGATADKFEWQAKHASKTDLIGIHESDDLNNLLPSETVLLSNPALQTLFFKRFAEKKLQTFEFEDRIRSFEVDENRQGNKKGKNNKKGPFIICVDTSGSMLGMPETIAKTICLAILKIALKENRNCYLITFSVGIVTLDMTDLKNNMAKIVDFLSMSFHGGTDASPALAQATQMLETPDFAKADILMISDFQMPPIQPVIAKKIQEAQKKETKFHSLVISDYRWGLGYTNEQVVSDFDHNWYYNPRDKNSIFQLAKNLKQL